MLALKRTSYANPGSRHINYNPDSHPPCHHRFGGGVIVYDTICSNNHYTIRGNDPIPSDIPHHYAWVVSSDGGASWQRIPNSNRRDLSLIHLKSEMKSLSVLRLLYKRYLYAPETISESDIIGLVVTNTYTINRLVDTVTPCVASTGFTVSTPLASTFEWKCVESGKTLQPQAFTATSSKYCVKVADLKSTDGEMPSGHYNILLTVRQSGGCVESARLKVFENPATVNPFNSRELAVTYSSNQLALNRNWGGVDAQRWTIATEEVGKLTINAATGLLSGITTTFLKDITVDAVCADYPDVHYQQTLNESVRNFGYTGTPQEIFLPSGTYTMECWGAQGGKYSSGYVGANGAYTRGDISLDPPRTFFAYVGKMGDSYSANHSTVVPFNGGGKGYSGGGDGGGASDFRLVGGSWNNITSLRSRVMVAAGGGGSDLNSMGGMGGKLCGGNGTWTQSYASGSGGTQTDGGQNYLTQRVGGFGYGGSTTSGGIDGGGGGGGYYGGSSGNGGQDGGGGGSSFISGYLLCNAVNEAGAHTNQCIHYSGLYFFNALMTANARSSNGYARITAQKNYVDHYEHVRTIKNYGTYRAWSDGTFARSAQEYRNSGSPYYRYEGDIGTGIYRIDPDGPIGGQQPFNAYCDMTTAGGGWTMVVAQYEADPVPNWNEGIQSDYDPTLASRRGFALNNNQIPPHMQVAFGKDLTAATVGYSQMLYHAGNLGRCKVYNYKTNQYFQIHRCTSDFYDNHNPERSIGYDYNWNNTLTYDQCSANNGSWAFSPQHELQASRGHSYLGWSVESAGTQVWQGRYTYHLQNFAWTVWVR